MDIHTLKMANKIQKDIWSIDCAIEYIESFLKESDHYNDEYRLLVVPKNANHPKIISDAPDVIKIILKNSLEELIKQKKDLEKVFEDL